VRPSCSVTWPELFEAGLLSISTMSASFAPSNTGVATGTPVAQIRRVRPSFLARRAPAIVSSP
jgi:hypothetical protein